MGEVVRLERELVQAKRKEAKALEECFECDGQGHFLDTTYDRTGVNVWCSSCHGTGLPEVSVEQIIKDAFAPYRKNFEL